MATNCQLMYTEDEDTTTRRGLDQMDKQAEFERMLNTLRQQLPMLKERYHVQTLSAFGSYARHEQDTGSDLDILVTFSEPPGLLTFMALENHLSDFLGVKVDLVMRSALKRRIGQRILQETVPV